MGNSRPAAGEHVESLEVRVRRVLDGDGEVSEQATVYCPLRDQSVHVDDCSVCGRGGGLHFDPVTKGTTIQCRLPAEARVAEAASERWGKAGPGSDAATPIATLMSKDVLCVRPDTSVDELLELMLDRGVSGVPVVDEAGKPVGIVSKTDLLREAYDRGDTAEIERPRAPGRRGVSADLGAGFHVTELPRAVAADVMTPVVLMLNEREPIGHAAALMAYEGVHRLPVVSDLGEVIGLLSSLDILRWFGRKSGYIVPERPRPAR